MGGIDSLSLTGHFDSEEPVVKPTQSGRFLVCQKAVWADELEKRSCGLPHLGSRALGYIGETR